MRHLFVLTTMLFALSAPLRAQDHATVQRLADQFAETFNKTAASGIGELYAEDAILVPPRADMRMGRKDIQAFWTRQAKEHEDLTVAVLDVKPLGPDAARAVVRAEMSTKGGDKPKHLTGRNVVVLQKVGTDWKLATHIWNFGAESNGGAMDHRDEADSQSSRAPDRDRLQADRDAGERREARRDRGGERRFSDRDRDFWSRHFDEVRPRYRDGYDRRRGYRSPYSDED